MAFDHTQLVEPAFARTPQTATGLMVSLGQMADVLTQLPAVDFVEVHAENFLVEGGPRLHWLERLALAYPLHLHGVALSLGGEQPLNAEHLDGLKRLNERFKPQLLSEHLAWCQHGDAFANDLLPLPYTQDTLARCAQHIDQAQSAWGATC